MWLMTNCNFWVPGRAMHWWQVIKRQEMSCWIMGPRQSLYFSFRAAITQGKHSLGCSDWCLPRDRALMGSWWTLNVNDIRFLFQSCYNATAIHNILICHCCKGITKCHVLQRSVRISCERNCAAMSFNEAHSVRNTMKDVILMETEALGC